jgi:hypothetical protein
MTITDDEVLNGDEDYLLTVIEWLEGGIAFRKGGLIHRLPLCHDDTTY